MGVMIFGRTGVAKPVFGLYSGFMAALASYRYDASGGF